MEMIEIPTHLIDEDKDQPRYQFGEEQLQELMSSIGEIGLLSPIKVRTTEDGRYKIIYGNRRYKACSMLGKATIPCIVSNVTDETEIYLEQIAENLTREGFSPIEEGEAFNKLLNDPKFASSVKYLSGKLGKPEAYIRNKVELLKFGPAVKKLVVSGTDIRKDLLTEDQLLPLKDLPMEFRDPLALIMARDEMPVSDVKRIARLFKDKELSESTKSKLLYKTGPSLLETWSSYETSRKERARAAEAKAEARAEAAAEVKEATAEAKAAHQAQAGAPSAAGSAASDFTLSQAQQSGAAGDGGQAATLAANPAAPESLAAGLKRMLDALPEPIAQTPAYLAALDALNASEVIAVADQLDALMNQFEQHLASLRQVREIVKNLN